VPYFYEYREDALAASFNVQQQAPPKKNPLPSCHAADTSRSAFHDSSLMSLFESADKDINARLEAMRPRSSLREVLARPQKQTLPQPPLLDGFLNFKVDTYINLSFPSYTCHADLSNDGMPLLLPPRRLLEPIVEPYFHHIAGVVPIMARVPCLDAIERYYADEAFRDDEYSAWAVLFNYMILFCFVGKYMPLDRPSSDVDIASITQFERPFVANIRRAFSVTHKFLAPKLVNVQALLALVRKGAALEQDLSSSC
jgi:hypothetical protein